MELKEAIQLLKSHNEWRREDREQAGHGLKMTDPKKLGIAIDKVVSEFENLFISGVVVNEANPNSKEHQVKLLREIMQGDEELGLYSEVELVCDENDKKSICKNPLSHECCNKHHKRI